MASTHRVRSKMRHKNGQTNKPYNQSNEYEVIYLRDAAVISLISLLKQLIKIISNNDSQILLLSMSI